MEKLAIEQPPDHPEIGLGLTRASKMSILTRDSQGGSATIASLLPRYTKASVKAKQNLKTRMLEQKIREQEAKRRHSERLYRRKLLKRQKRVQMELEYISFPTMLGWYFDGFFTHHFFLCKEWADILNEVEEEFIKKKFADYRETFQEKVARNFWPPSVYNRLIFRTRGVYLDLNEVLRDPPQTPANANFQLADEEQWDMMLAEANNKDPLAEKRGKHIGTVPGSEELTNKHSWYFDEDRGGFFPISSVDPDRIYYDQSLGIWRLKRSTRLYAGDFYFDFKRAHFALKNGKFNQNFYKFDKTFHVWILKSDTGGNATRITPKDYAYDEESCIWILRRKVPKGTFQFDENGFRHAKRIPIPGPDDYFFVLSDGTFRPKQPGLGSHYVYDQNIGVWVPTDEVDAENKPAPSSRKKHLVPADYYFQTHTGRFALKMGRRNDYEFDANNRFYRKKKCLSGKYHPRNWYWDNKLKKWVYGKKSRRQGIFTQILHWRPVRDYERPWLDYTQGHNYLRFNKEAYGFDRAQAGAQGGPEWGDPDFKGLDFDSKTDPDADPLEFKDDDEEQLSEAAQNAAEIQRQLLIAAGQIPDPNSSTAQDTAVDRKRLKCSNLGGVIDEKELKAFFASATAVTKPKAKGALGWGKDDFLYIQFGSDEAASAALKTMQGVEIKGQAIKLTFPRRFQR